MAERFWSHVDRGAKDVCWLWRGTVGPTGYGMFSAKRFKPKAYRTHRLAWELTHGPIPEGLWILHHCDTPLCVNPAHLYAGTRQDNWDDVVARDRRKGERSPSAKLTDTQVREIRAIYAAGGISQRALAKQYGISNSTIDLVVRRVRWTHI